MKNRIFVYQLGLSSIIAWSICLNIWTIISESIRLDEAQSLWFAGKSVWGLLKVTAQDVHVPLYGLTLHGWLNIWGNDITIARLLSFSYFLLNIPLIYKLGKETGGRIIGYLSTALFCLSPFIGWYSAETRMYTLFSLITTINQLFFLRMIRSNFDNGKGGYWISALLGFYTHYFFTFLVAAQFLYVVLVTIKERRLKREKIRDVRQGMFAMMALGPFLLFIPWLLYMYKMGMAANMKPLLGRPTTFNLIQVFVNYVVGFQTYNLQGILVSMWPLLALILFLIYTRKTKRHIKNLDYLVMATIIPVILVFLLSFIRPIFLPRYLIIVTPTLFVTMAWLLNSHERKTAMGLSALTMLALVGFGFNQRVSRTTPVKENYDAATEYLEINAKSNDVITLSAPFTIYPVEYRYLGAAKLETIPEWDRFTVGPIPEFGYDKLSVQIEEYKKQYNKLYVLLSYDQGYEKKIRDFLDEQLKLEEVRHFPVDIELRVYSLEEFIPLPEPQHF